MIRKARPSIKDSSKKKGPAGSPRARLFRPRVALAGTVGARALSHLRVALMASVWLNLVPTRQFLDHCVFFSEPTYATTNLVVVRQRGEAGFQDVDLDCLGTLGEWKPVGSQGTFEVAHVDLVRAGVPVKNCAAARQVAHSEGRFGLTAWGTDCSASQGYPAGGDFGPINEVIVPLPVR